jgi:uncharacterized protein YciI
MRTYVVAFLYAGPAKIEDPARSEELQRAHLANIGRLHGEGKIILAGPFRDKGDLRGLFLFDTESLEEARAWCDSDPAVAAGALRIELKPWFSAAGITIDQPAARRAKGGPAGPPAT